MYQKKQYVKKKFKLAVPKHGVLQIDSKKSVCNTGDPGFDPWVRKIPQKRKWLLLQYSCLENSMDRGNWWATVHWVVKVRHN